jgi:CubicO group peptidase (beta-lactamase class C family)
MTAVHGDAALVTRLEELLGRRHPVAAAAVVTPAGTIAASIGAELTADFEIGSISKGVTGLLYAEALTRGEVEASTTLGDLLPLGPAPASGVSLGALSSHRSGLPRLPRSVAPLRRTIALWRTGANPYGETLSELVDQARDVQLGRPAPRYSNLGFELLGHALAAAAGTTYTELVRRRVAEPLGLSSLYAPASAEELRPTAVAGRSRSGKPREPWTGEALAPAGGLRATITDMARLTGALLDGTAPGITALDPVAPFVRVVRIGAAWITIERAGREVTWHNGGTGGFRSWLGLDRQAGTGVVLLTATSASVDRHGFTLLTGVVESGMS